MATIRRSTLPALLAGLLALPAAARADVSLAPLFTDHAVLQREKAVPIWGRADPGENVTVGFQGQTVAAAAGGDGRWIAWLSPLSADSAGSDLVVTGKKGARTLHDVVVGEVWLCSGQSNMEFAVDDPKNATFRVQNAEAEVAAAQWPLIRQYKVARQVAAAPVTAARGAWISCSPRTAGEFTAVGYFFARDIFQRLGIPVGIIASTWGGTVVESWMSPAALAGDPAFAIVGPRWQKMLADFPRARAAYEAAVAEWGRTVSAARAAGPASFAAFIKSHAEPRPPHGSGPEDPWTPSGLFNGMIYPLAPYALRGALWYQGESNAEAASEYHRLFAAMITDWREQFGQGDIPFYWVQLANYRYPRDPTGKKWAFLREAQAQALSLPATGQAVSIDVGDPDNIHPRNKQEVGRRLALIARANVYGIAGDFSGPVFAGANIEGGTMRVRFKFADNGLTAAGRPLQSFELAGADRRFHPALASIAGDSVVVRSAEVPAPVAVRYAWSNAPEANLFNGSGLPAAPFRSDSW
jgi:sialate O-acetylesterase